MQLLGLQSIPVIYGGTRQQVLTPPQGLKFYMVSIEIIPWGDLTGLDAHDTYEVLSPLLRPAATAALQRCQDVVSM